MNRKLFRIISVFVFPALLILSVGYVKAQTPGQVPVFDQPGTGTCNSAGGNDCIDSVIMQSGGNIGIGTTAPVARLHVAGGNLNLENSTATSGNLLKNGSPYLHNFGVNNTFVGFRAGNLTMTGVHNAAVGDFTLQSNTTGLENTASGYSALSSNTTANYNTASGAYALVSNTTGSFNTASGSYTLSNNTTGGSNTASGQGALYSNTTGQENTASGGAALYYNTIGSWNTASGNLALYYNTEGNNNTASGYQALSYNTTGLENTASGYRALYSNTTGRDNTASGQAALYSNTTGDANTANGLGALYGNTTGSANTAVGYGANVCIGCGDLFNSTAIGAYAVVNASNKIRLGNAFVTVVEGPPYSTVSDKNAKENFKSVDAEEVLRKIRDMNVTTWNYIGQDAKQFRHYGPVAQEFFAAFGDDGVGAIGSPTTITSTDMNGVLMLAVQALGLENAELKARIEALERLVK